MGQINLQGSLNGGPAAASSDAFPGSTLNIPISLRSSPKGFNAATGVLQRQVAASSYLTLHEVGSDGSVTKANTFYIKSNGPILLRCTFDDGSGGNIIAVEPINGIIIKEVDDTKFLKRVEVQGNSLIEYFACGQS